MKPWILHLSVLVTLEHVRCGGPETGYLNTACNSGKTIADSYRLESSTGLTYYNDVDCTFTTTVPIGQKIQVLFRQFELEEKSSGSCVDYVNFYDGASTSAALLNVEPLCGTNVPANVTSSSNTITLRFFTDVTAVGRGFEILFVAFTDGPCRSSEFSCTNGICIDPSGECDDFNQCGDNSDEAQCAVASPESAADNTGLIIGMVFLGVAFFSLAVTLGVFFYRKRKFKKLLEQFHSLPEIRLKDPQPSYPVTHNYMKRQFRSTDMRRSDEKQTHEEVVTDHVISPYRDLA